jgi:hypothetical protein
LKNFLKPIEVADILKVSPTTVIASCRNGQFPGAVLVGKRWRIPESAIKDPPKPLPLEDVTLTPGFDVEAVFERWSRK